ncbi:substrate-binding periplasmic protein [Fundidesulfovibrio agrisoli]|uniref:substrate-binding periplasmic protein n=1 Tax=Fundidesulfovibrio agrisoli TaxID=2922717 RepID=UPI001FAC5F5F|nr:transporter substrate-binding domain-containing protein [Fundidesulfovibrio agrisoli]
MPIRRTAAFLALTLIVLLMERSAFCAAIHVVYPNRPPYFYTKDGAPAGTLYEATARILAEAGIEAIFTEMPSRRILYEMQRNPDCELCSFGWFKTAQREAFARFSLPFHQDSPLIAVFRKGNYDRSKEEQTLAQMMAPKSATVGVVAGWSYGDAVDALLHKAQGQVVEVADRHQQALMLAGGRFLFTLLREDELPSLLELAGIGENEVEYVAVTTGGQGSTRHIMCGRGVPEEVMERIDAAILRLRQGR